ncbi:MAG TPA: thioredoxin family protein [Pirellulales bacterium]|nr:thioredoxin family protein [Pirellulales bacterium]
MANLRNPYRGFIWTACLAALAMLLVGTKAKAQLTQLQPLDSLSNSANGPGGEKLKASGFFTPAENGKPAMLYVTAELAPSWHTYSITQAAGGPNKTRLKVATSADYKVTGDFHAKPAAEIHHYEDIWPGLVVEEHEGRVTWSAPLEIAAGVNVAKLEIPGAVYAQVCAKDCLPPTDYKFVARLATSKDIESLKNQSTGPNNESPSKGPPQGATENTQPSVAQNPSFNPSAPTAMKGVVAAVEAAPGKSLAAVLLSAFLGGVILNLMPCVLPVIGLKLLTFVEQSHQHRSRVFLLNVWYTLGLMSVFMVLATLACGASLGLRSENLSWGEQFSSTAFNIVMSGVVFVMALSFLGVWEIPIPGFVGSGLAAEAATHEGAAGAFAKGVLSTVLATPCSGPFLGPVFGFTLQQSPGVIYSIFAAIGLGMASPYLVIGAFPRLIRFLPKPGAWMDTFKQIMGFVLLGTVVFLFTFLNRDYVVPTFGMLIGLWAACWWIGRTPLTAEFAQKLKGWVQGGVIGAVAGYASFALLLPHASLLPWQPFSAEALAKYRAEGKTVMVDFTADWCLTCKTNLKFAIETDNVRKLIQANNVVPLLADWTHDSPEIKDALAALRWNSIPVLAIFPADRPDKPIVLHDLITQSQLLEALEQAGPSQAIVADKQTAMQ